jgi:hypothetical protein
MQVNYQHTVRVVIVVMLVFLVFSKGKAQTLGGQAAYNFLKLPPSPMLSAAGGVNISYKGEIGATAANPALLQQDVTRQIQSSFNAYIAGTKAYSLTGAFYSEKLATTFGGHVHFLDYGTLPQTDDAGNTMGQFRPIDYVVQASAARQYLQKWTYGLSLKFIRSSYGQYRSAAIAADVGLHYQDSARLFSAGFVVRNMGAQLTTYSGEKEELPFDLQVGVTKRLANAPIGFSVTAQHLQTFNLLYNDTVFNRDNNLTPPTTAINKVLTHFILATHIYAGQHLEATVGYNFLKRRELSIDAAANGFTGFSAGLRIRFNKLQIIYARSGYQRGVAANLIGVTIHLDKLLGFDL